METKRDKKRGISPVIAAIILVAVTVALAIGVAVWMGALTFTFMATEQLVILDATYDGINTTSIDVKNTGTTDITHSRTSLEPSTNVNATSFTISAGTTVTITVDCSGDPLTVGNNYEVEIRTGRGNRFTYMFTA